MSFAKAGIVALVLSFVGTLVVGMGEMEDPAGCAYDGVTYDTGESWQTPCDTTGSSPQKMKCTCVEARSISCQYLCLTWNDLPDSCTLSVPEDFCCEAPTCPPNVMIPSFDQH